MIKRLILVFLSAVGVVFVNGQIGNVFLGSKNQEPSKPDTIKCWMLCSDTMTTRTLNAPRDGDRYDTSTIEWHFNDKVFVINGYEARVGTWVCCGGRWGDSYYMFYQHVQYLDGEKKPLKYFVWQSH